MPKKSIPLLIAISLMLTFSSCTCVYFNTFHNIRKNFGAAEKSRRESGRDEARGAEVKQYNDAIAKSSRVLERHPTSSYVDDALYIIGTSYYYLGEYEKASRKFKELFANYPQSEYVARSRLLMAKAKLKLKEEAEAVVLFEEIFENEKDKEMKAQAARSLGEYYFENRDYDKSNTYFMALVDSLGNQSERLNALIYVADGYFDMFSLKTAIDEYNVALKQEPDTLQYYHIMFRLAECDIYLNKITEGIEKLSGLADNEVYYDSLAPIRLKMAEGYEWEGDFNSAIDTYERIVDENPRRDPAAIAYYRLGLIYQYDFEDLGKARSYYQKSREERNSSPVAEDATRRASKLALLERYTRTGDDASEADTAQEVDQSRLDELAENEFLLAELFYFDLEKPDSAINTYQTLLDRYPASRLAPRALMSMAHIYEDEYHDTTGADSLLRQVLVKYAHYDEAQDVIDMLGLAGTVADTGYAAIPFAKAEGFLSDFQESDSSMYYVQQNIDSILAADSAAAVQDSIAADSARQGDSLIVEDVYLQSDSSIVSDSARSHDSLIAERQRIADSTRAADSLRFVERRRIYDSLRTADSVRVADSVRAEELAHLADSLKALRNNPGKMADTNKLDASDSLLPSDTLSLAEMVARAHDTADSAAPPGTTAGGAADTGVMITGPPAPEEIHGPSGSMSRLDSLRLAHAQAAQDTTPPPGQLASTTPGTGSAVIQQMGPPLPSLDPNPVPPGQPGSTRQMPAPNDIRSRASVGAAASGDTTATPASTIAQTTDTGAVDDTVVVPQKTLGEYWDEALVTAKDRYDANQLSLLDSARQYYRYVIDSFPYSRYNAQSQYVLLWTYDHYLAPGDSSLPDLYRNFVDSFPQTEYAQAIADEYGIRSAAMIPQRQNQNRQQEQQDQPETDSTAIAQIDSTGQGEQESDSVSSTVSQFITKDGKQLEPANKYFLQEDVPFEYPLEALAWKIEDILYFQIRIDFSGKVVDAVLMNPTQSQDLNDRATETVKNTRFDNGRIPADLYDSWFYYRYEVHPPAQLRQ